MSPTATGATSTSIFLCVHDLEHLNADGDGNCDADADDADVEADGE